MKWIIVRRSYDNILPPLSYSYPGADGDFGPRRQPSPGASNNHHGYDLRAAAGTVVSSPYAGRVVDFGADTVNSKAGNWIAIQHELPNGTVVITRYLHLQEKPPGFKIGDQVNQGDQIGKVGNTGSVSTGPHLHYEERVAYGNPQANGLYPWNQSVAQDPEFDPSVSRRLPWCIATSTSTSPTSSRHSPSLHHALADSP